MAKLSDADLLALHRNGGMGLIYAHLVSMGNLRKLVQWRLERQAADQAAAAATPTAAAPPSAPS